MAEECGLEREKGREGQPRQRARKRERERMSGDKRGRLVVIQGAVLEEDSEEGGLPWPSQITMND